MPDTENQVTIFASKPVNDKGSVIEFEVKNDLPKSIFVNKSYYNEIAIVGEVLRKQKNGNFEPVRTRESVADRKETPQAQAIEIKPGTSLKTQWSGYGYDPKGQVSDRPTGTFKIRATYTLVATLGGSADALSVESVPFDIK